MSLFVSQVCCFLSAAFDGIASVSALTLLVGKQAIQPIKNWLKLPKVFFQVTRPDVEYRNCQNEGSLN